MSLSRRNKKKLNTVVFNKEDFLILDYEQLLKVNGAGGSSGGGSSGSSSSSSASSSGPSASSSSSASSSPSGSSSSGKGSGQSSPSSYESNNTTEQKGIYVENSNEGVANANPGDKIIRNDGTEVTLTQGDIDWAREQLPNSNASTSNNFTSNNKSSYANNEIQNQNFLPVSSPAYFNQLDFSDDFGEQFGNSACAVTSLINELSEQYTANTGFQMTEEQAVTAIQAAINSGNVSANGATDENGNGIPRRIK